MTDGNTENHPLIPYLRIFPLFGVAFVGTLWGESAAEVIVPFTIAVAALMAFFASLSLVLSQYNDENTLDIRNLADKHEVHIVVAHLIAGVLLYTLYLP